MTAWGLIAYLEVAHTMDVKIIGYSWKTESLKQPNTFFEISKKTVVNFMIDQSLVLAIAVSSTYNTQSMPIVSPWWLYQG